MTTNDQPDTDNHDRLLVANLLDSVHRLRYAYKSQEKAASRYECYEAVRKWLLILCTALATGTFVVSLFTLAGSELLGTLAVGLIAMVATLASFLGDVLNFSKRQQEHHDAGSKVRSLFVRSETLLSDYIGGALSATAARRMRDDLNDHTDQLLLVIPRTTRQDYEKADKALSNDEKTSIWLDEALAVLFPAKVEPHAHTLEEER